MPILYCGISWCFMLRTKELLRQAHSQLILTLKRQWRVAVMQKPAARFKSSWIARNKTLFPRSIKQGSFSGCTIKVRSSMLRPWSRYLQWEVSSRIFPLFHGYASAFLVVIVRTLVLGKDFICRIKEYKSHGSLFN